MDASIDYSESLMAKRRNYGDCNSGKLSLYLLLLLLIPKSIVDLVGGGNALLFVLFGLLYLNEHSSLDNSVISFICCYACATGENLKFSPEF